MAVQRQKRWILPLALILVVAGAAVLVFSSIKESSVYFVNVSEALALEPGKLQQARLFGMVHEDIALAPSSLGVTFRLLDKVDAGKSMMVRYEGAVPDTFKAGVEVIVEGSYQATENVFHAKTLLTKCPSKYEKQSSEQEIQNAESLRQRQS
jgi:cytochrome c-type biogenesis protein CcmE